MKVTTQTPQTIDEYIAQCAQQVQPYLSQIRELVLSECPDAKEKISYQIPTFNFHYSLVGFGETKNGKMLLWGPGPNAHALDRGQGGPTR